MSDTALPLLTVRDLAFAWPGRPLFAGWSADVDPGLTWVTGDEGCGKSTLLRILAGELRPDRGTLRLHERPDDPPDTAPVAVLDAVHNPQPWQGRVFRPDARDPALDALTARACWARWAARHGGFAPQAVAQWAEDLGLIPHLDKELFRLSAGTRRKVGLLAAFASAAALTLVDDPFAALDKPSIDVVEEGLEAVADHPRRAWVVATHTPLEFSGPVLTLVPPA